MEAITRIGTDLGLVVKAKSLRSSLRQAVLSLGDERLGRAIFRYIKGGTSWKAALSADGVDARFPHEARGAETPFPWDVIKGPVERGILFKRYNLLMKR